MKTVIRPARESDVVNLTRVVLAGRGLQGMALEMQVERDVARFRQQGLIGMVTAKTLVAFQGPLMVAVMRYGENEGEVHLSRPEVWPGVEEPDVCRAFLQAYWKHMKPSTQRAVYLDYPVPSSKWNTMGAVFAENGFSKLVERVDMRMNLSKPIAPPDDRLTFSRFDPKIYGRFLQSYKESFKGTLDPMMEWDSRNPERSLEIFHQNFGNFDPNLWILATDRKRRDVGFALFQTFDGGRYAGDTVLLYMAVLPFARGLGYGEEILRAGLRAVRERRGKGAPVSLTVSKPNKPAAAIYRRMGFRAVEEYAVYTQNRK
jgi:ribosomal protein S18 acetylase RimI-like enzyme